MKVVLHYTLNIGLNNNRLWDGCDGDEEAFERQLKNWLWAAFKSKLLSFRTSYVTPPTLDEPTCVVRTSFKMPGFSKVFTDKYITALAAPMTQQCIAWVCTTDANFEARGLSGPGSAKYEPFKEEMFVR